MSVEFVFKAGYPHTSQARKNSNLLLINGSFAVTAKPLLNTLMGQRQARPPVWVMRQAGRYLPEYRALRANAKDFVDFCLSPDMAAEATLQPLRRFDLDAAILFADILLIPHALGSNLRFVKGEGPQMDPVSDLAGIKALRRNWDLQKLVAVGETVAQVKAVLPAEKTLIGFAGAPWTVATYMVEGKGSRDKFKTRVLAWKQPDVFQALMDLLVETSIEYLEMQAKAGADALKIFDSWADNLPLPLFERVIIEPTRQIIAGLRKRGIDCPIIGFPRGCGSLIGEYATRTGCTAIALDQSQTPEQVNRLLPENFPVQGNLDNALLNAGGDQLMAEVERIIAGFSHRPHVFNLGHGITPDTPIENMELLVKTIKQG